MIKKIFLFSILTLVLVEFFSFAASKFNLLIVNNDPDYIYSYGNKWRTETTAWGSWHKPNFKDRHESRCFSVDYKSNNIGARDNENYQEEKKSNSIILLGDSFAEGFGVNFDDTFHQQLEKKIDKNILNFGSAGHFGPLQSHIIYEKLAKKYNHDEIIFMFFPHNDFLDNNWDYWKRKVRKFRNRPYLIENEKNNEYEIFYPSTDNNVSLFLRDFIFNDFKNFLIKYTYTSNTLRTINFLYQSYFFKDSKNEIGELSYFYEDIKSIKSSLYSINNIFEQSDEIKKKTLIIIPTINDLNKIEKGEDYKKSFWFKEIKSITKNTSTQLIDLADYVNSENYSKMIYECDFHWNPKGHSFIANLIFEKIYN